LPAGARGSTNRGMNQDKTLLLIGAGKMGGAMLDGWLKSGLSAAKVTVVDPHPSQRLSELAQSGLSLVATPEDVTTKADTIVLATKPQSLDHAAPALQAAAHAGTLLISILAGKTIANLRARAPLVRAIVRAMPNTPAAVGRGITGCAASPEVTEQQRSQATSLLEAIGQVEWVLDESLIDAVTALSGSGPAYIFHLVESMAAAGEAVGLPADLALRLARRTVEGAGELLFQDQASSAATLRQNVTSPGGTTAAALEILMGPDGLTPLMTRAVRAARHRAEKLSG
jgi:pyrroline-5-carboxylate reductase